MPPNSAELISILTSNRFVGDVLERMGNLDLPDCYLTAGCLFQTVWNHLHQFPLTQGILDYDVFYCDRSDLSWEAEDAVIRRVSETFHDLGAPVEVRNQARVHIWFEDHFGIPLQPFKTTTDAIDNFLATSCCIGIRKVGNEVDVYAPYGLDDLFGLIVRPNPDATGPGWAYAEKTQRWRHLWPNLNVMPWPTENN
ncbi:MAG: uncharacterized protein QOG04_2188 [Actinomycetota bacterium]|jgi:hypothetical protein|nr:uncharacterized protein [Actinomycetota bacterium]